jgi:hypothetical protein
MPRAERSSITLNTDSSRAASRPATAITTISASQPAIQPAARAIEWGWAEGIAPNVADWPACVCLARRDAYRRGEPKPSHHRAEDAGAPVQPDQLPVAEPRLVDGDAKSPSRREAPASDTFQHSNSALEATTPPEGGASA